MTKPTFNNVFQYTVFAGNKLTTMFFYSSEKPLFFCKELQNLEVEECKTALLCCELSKPGVAVQWKKGTVLLKSGEKYKIRQDGCKLHLEIHDLRTSDSDSYKCCTGSLLTIASLRVKGMFFFVTLKINMVHQKLRYHLKKDLFKYEK